MKALNVSFNLKYQTFQGLKMALNKLLQKKRKKKEFWLCPKHKVNCNWVTLHSTHTWSLSMVVNLWICLIWTLSVWWNQGDWYRKRFELRITIFYSFCISTFWLKKVLLLFKYWDWKILQAYSFGREKLWVPNKCTPWKYASPSNSTTVIDQ